MARKQQSLSGYTSVRQKVNDTFGGNDVKLEMMDILFDELTEHERREMAEKMIYTLYSRIKRVQQCEYK